MRKRVIMLVAILACGMELEAELCKGVDVEDAKVAVMNNYHLAAGEVKSWEIR
jgi:hypothetical protein